MSKNTLFFTIGGLFFAVILGGVSYYFFYNSLTPLESFNKTYSTGSNLYRSGNLDEAVGYFESAASAAPSKEKAAQAKRSLALALLQSDPARGIALLKEISLDTTYASLTRANAAYVAIEYFATTIKTQFAFEHLFTGPQWSTFIQNTTKDSAGARLAARKASEWAYSLSPTFLLAYSVGEWYANKLIYLPDEEKKNEYTNIVQSLMVSGDQLLENEPQDEPFGQYLIALGHTKRAHLLEGLYTAEKIDSNEVRQAYDKAMDFYLSDRSFSSQRDLLRTRYNLAAFLVRENITVAQTEISAPLSTINSWYEKNGPTAPLFGYLQSIAALNIPEYKDALLLADADPQFKSLLNEITK